MANELSYALLSSIRHRPENFGGVLFDLETHDAYILNQAGYLLASKLESGAGTSLLCAALESYVQAEGSRLSRPSTHKYISIYLRELARLGILDAPRLLHHRSPTVATSPLRPRRVETHADSVQLKSPLIASLNLMFTCNLKCQHCYVGSTAERKPNALSVDEACHIVSQLADLEVFEIVLTGGEATLFRGLPRVIDCGRSRGMSIALNTNGTTMTREYAGELSRVGLSRVKTSLDSPRPDDHDVFRGRRNAFQRTVRGIRYMVEAGLRVDIHSTIAIGACETRSDVAELLAIGAATGATKVHFGRLFSTGRARDDMKVEKSSLNTTVEFLHSLQIDGHPQLGRIPPLTLPTIRHFPGYDGCGKCGNGMSVYIDYEAGLYPCANLYEEAWRFGDLRRQSLLDAYSSSEVIRTLHERLRPIISATHVTS